VRLGLISDLHWAASPDVEASWHNVYDFAGLPGRVDRARRLFADQRVDALVVAGDLCHAGDHASAGSVLGRLGADAGPPVLAVSGNHDSLRHLRELIEPPTVLLDGAVREIAGWRLAGIAIAPDQDTGRFRWDRRWPAGQGCVDVLVSHFPVVSRAQRVAGLGFSYPGDLLDLAPLLARVRATGEPTIVLSGHIHVRESHAAGTVLQLSAGALIEAPFEAAVIDLERDAETLRVRRRSIRLGPSAGARDPVLAPDDETWSFCAGSWHEADHPVAATRCLEAPIPRLDP
jgi:predicted phosphodiesterase